MPLQQAFRLRVSFPAVSFQAKYICRAVTCLLLQRELANTSETHHPAIAHHNPQRATNCPYMAFPAITQAATGMAMRHGTWKVSCMASSCRPVPHQVYASSGCASRIERILMHVAEPSDRSDAIIPRPFLGVRVDGPA